VKTIETDVLVVGAGPGGSIAAKFAALKGMRTLLIEKRQEIGSPVRCAEGISKDWLPECGIEVDARWISAIPETARVFAPDGSCFMMKADRAGNEVGIVIDRHQFDKALAADAARAGARILLKTFATDVTRANGAVTGVVSKSFGHDIEIRARITIGADGFESQVGRWAGIRTDLEASDVVTTFQYQLAGIDCDPRYCDFYAGSCAPGGYIWIFPKGNDIANVGLGVQLSLLEGKGEPKAYLDRWIATQPQLAKGTPLAMVGGAVSTNKPLPKTVTDGLMLVGDAARLIDPLTGGGIMNACLSGMLAGEIAAQAVQRGDVSEKFLQRYEKGWRKRLAKKLERNWWAKEKVVEIDDETISSVIATLSEVDLDANTLSLLMAVGRKHPKLVAGFAHLMLAG
jgi:digeranylgeranylglycerophospholipid reductase